MTLERRLAKLEGRRGGAAFVARDAEAFVARFDRLAEAVNRLGDFRHLAEASPAANLARALLRGDDAKAEAILAKATAEITMAEGVTASIASGQFRGDPRRGGG